MVDCRPTEAASVSPVTEPPPAPVAPTPPPARASTPAAAPPPPTNFTGMAGNGPTAGYAPMPPYMYGGGGVKGGVVLCAPPIPLMPGPLPHNVNASVQRSMQPNGADLPMNDIPTLRYFFNLGVEYMWSLQHPASLPHLAPPPVPPPPLRFYSPIKDLAQDMQQNLSLQERTQTAQNGSGENKQHEKPQQGQGHNIQGKPGQQRPMIAPRFRGGGGDGGTLPHQNRNFNNNKGRFNNNRRNSHGYGNPANEGEPAGAGGGEAPGPVYTMPYMQYPPLYHYYPVEADPGAMGMISYLSYPEEAGDYYSPIMPPYFPPLQHHPPLNPHHSPLNPHHTHQ